MQVTNFKRKRGTTRELVSVVGVLTVMTGNQVPDNALPEDEDAAARLKLQEILGGCYAAPTGSGDELRTGVPLAAVVQRRSLERCVEGGGVIQVDGVGIYGCN